MISVKLDGFIFKEYISINFIWYMFWWFWQYHDACAFLIIAINNKFYIRKNNNKIDSIATRAHSYCPIDTAKWSRRLHVLHAFLFNDDEIYCHCLIYSYNFTCSLFWTAHKLTNDKSMIWILKEISTLRYPFKYFHFNSPHQQSSKIVFNDRL